MQAHLLRSFSPSMIELFPIATDSSPWWFSGFSPQSSCIGLPERSSGLAPVFRLPVRQAVQGRSLNKTTCIPTAATSAGGKEPAGELDSGVSMAALSSSASSIALTSSTGACSSLPAPAATPRCSGATCCSEPTPGAQRQTPLVPAKPPRGGRSVLSIYIETGGRWQQRLSRLQQCTPGERKAGLGTWA